MSDLSTIEIRQLFNAHQVVQEMVLSYRGYTLAEHPYPERMKLASMDELFQLVPPAALGHLESFGEALETLFQNAQSTLRIKFLLSEPTEQSIGYMLGLGSHTFENKLTTFTQGKTGYLTETRAQTLLVVILRPINVMLQTTLFRLQSVLNTHIELFSVLELQLNPFDHVFQSKQELATIEFLTREDIDPETLPVELVCYKIIYQNDKKNKEGGSVTAKFLGARDGDVIKHIRQSQTLGQFGMRCVREITEI